MSSREEIKELRIHIREEQTRFILYLKTFAALAFSCLFVVPSQPTLSASSLDLEFSYMFLMLLFLVFLFGLVNCQQL